MRIQSVLLAAVFAVACGNKPAPQQPKAAAPAEAAASNVIRGKVTEKIDAAQYTYLKLQTGAGEVWTAVPKTPTAVGETVGVAGPIWMENFKSTTLNRTWDRIAFGVLDQERPTAAPGQQAPSASAHPGGPGMFAAAAANMPPGHPPTAPAADVGEVNVKKAGKSIAEIYAASASLKDKPISVRGKVVKVTNGVMGKNWLHLRDGTGSGATADLTVASDDTASIGDTILVNGTVHLNRDLGAGYHYDVLVEDAKIKTE